MNSDSRRNDGLSLPEIMVAILLLVTVLVPLVLVLSDSASAFTSLTRQNHMSTRAAVVMDRLIGELTNARFVSLTPPIPDKSSWVRFQKIVGFDGDKPIYGNPIQIDVVPMESDIEDGVDNDGDGLIDEGAIRIWEDVGVASLSPGTEDTQVTISTDLTSGGLSFTRIGAFLLIETSYQKITERDRPAVTSVLKSGVLLRRGE